MSGRIRPGDRSMYCKVKGILCWFSYRTSPVMPVTCEVVGKQIKELNECPRDKEASNGKS